MDKNAKSTIDDLNRKIASLQQKRDAMIRKEKDRKAKTQEKWKTTFMKELMKEIIHNFGDSFEEKIPPEELAKKLSFQFDGFKEAYLPAKDGTPSEDVSLGIERRITALSESPRTGGEDE